jgi:hypothetical protein
MSNLLMTITTSTYKRQERILLTSSIFDQLGFFSKMFMSVFYEEEAENRPFLGLVSCSNTPS